MEEPREAGGESESAPAPAASAPPAAAPGEPFARLVESGLGFLQQFAAALPAETNEGSKARRIEARQDADGSTFLAVPMPSREAVTRFVEGLSALLGSLQR